MNPKVTEITGLSYLLLLSIVSLELFLLRHGYNLQQHFETIQANLRTKHNFREWLRIVVGYWSHMRHKSHGKMDAQNSTTPSEINVRYQ